MRLVTLVSRGPGYATPRVRFTVRWLMAGVALAAVLAALALFFQRSSEAAQRDECRNHLRLISLGLINYSTVHDSFPAGTVNNDRLTPDRRLSWLVATVTYLEQWTWLLDLSQPWDAETNRITRCGGVEETPQPLGRILIFTCPAADGEAVEHMPGWTWYVGVAGVGRDAPELPNGHPRAGVFGYDRRTTTADVKDGLSNTLMLAETGVANGPWTAGGGATVRGLDPDRRPYIGRGRPFGGLHRGGVNVALADGSVRFLSESIDPRVFEALATVSGAEPLPDGWDR